MDWLEHRRIFFFWIQICRRGDADRSDDRGAKIRKNVTEEIRTHNNIKPVRMPHKMGCQYIDVVLIRADIRIIRRHLTETFIPERHGMDWSGVPRHPGRSRQTVAVAGYHRPASSSES